MAIWDGVGYGVGGGLTGGHGPTRTGTDGHGRTPRREGLMRRLRRRLPRRLWLRRGAGGSGRGSWGGLCAAPDGRGLVIGLELLRLDAKRTGKVSGFPVGQALETALDPRHLAAVGGTACPADPGNELILCDSPKNPGQFQGADLGGSGDHVGSLGHGRRVCQYPGLVGNYLDQG
jgi:hypothetical protein